MEDLYNHIYSSVLNKIPLQQVKLSIKSFINEDVISYCYSKSKYDIRKYNRIKLSDYSNELFEIILICWDINSETKIHDHPDGGCILHLINGKLEEYLYNSNLELVKTTKLEHDNTSYMDNRLGYHKIKSLDYSMSLHIYSPPNYKMKIMSETNV